MGLLPFNKTTRVNRGAYLGTAAGASIPSAAGKTPGDYYIITTAGGAYSIGDIAVVQVGSAGYDKISISSGVAAINGSNITTLATWRAGLDVAQRADALLRDGGLVVTGVSGSYLAGPGPGDIGTGDFSVALRIIVPPETTGGATRILFELRPSASSAANGFWVYLYNGNLFLAFRAADGSSERRAQLSGFAAANANTPVDLVFTRAGTTVALYVNGLLTSTTNTTFGGAPPADYGATVSSSHMRLAGDTGSSTFVGAILEAAVFNRALSDASSVRAFAVPAPDRWGSMTVQTSGTLVPGARYRIASFVAGDSFTNVGAGSNATGIEFVATSTTPTTWTNSSQILRIGAIVDLDLGNGAVAYAADRSPNGCHLVGLGGSIGHFRPLRGGCVSIIRVLSASDINTSSGVTRVLDLPANCAITEIEFDRTVAFDSGITLNVGTAGTPTKYVNAQSVASTGIVRVTSPDLASQSNSVVTPIYVHKSGSTTVGAVKIRVTVAIRG